MPFGPKESMQEMVHGKASSILAFAEMSPDKYIVEQSTGLKDANGKEIYESDILRVTTGEDGESYAATVKWFGDEGYPAFDLKDIPAAWNYDANALATIFRSGVETCEVIGNVHTNPELLED